LISVLDSTDVERMEEAKQALELVLSSDDMRGIPVLVLANKQDIARLSVKEISEKLSLHRTQGVREWHIQGCCALKGEGIYEGLDWLSNALNKSI